MSNDEEEEEERELSGSEDDDVFDQDMEALRRACMITGTNPDDLGTRYPCPSAAAAAGGFVSDEEKNDDDDDEDDDLGLLRNIRSRFSIPSDAFEPLSMKPLCSLPPAMSDEDEDDDFETLRAIQKRFVAYDNGALGENMEKQEQKTSNDSFVDAFDVCKELLDSDYPCQTTHHLGVHLEEQPSTAIEWHHTDSSRPSMSQPSYSSFPKSAKVFMDAIKKNRSFQKFLRSKLIQIEAKIEENKKLAERVKILKDFQVNCKRRTGRALSQKKDSRVQLISVKRSSPSKDSKVHEKKIPTMYFGPVENSHVANYRMALTKLPLSLDHKKWSEVERKNLEKGIRQQFQETALQIMLDQLSRTGESYGNLNDLDNILLSIKDLDITPENIREFLPKVNWEQVASMYVVGRSGAECQARWLNFEDPLINHNPWTAQEDKNLLLLVQKKGISSWFDIAVSLGTNRTPFQCLTRYQRSLNVSILKREWTKEEDAKLRSAVETYGESDWQSVASVLEGWTGTQCSNRWKKSLHPTREKVGRWTADEDKRLKVAQMLFGPRNWKKTAQFVPGRTEVQCRERWVNSLDPSLNWDKWTEEEDSKLRAAIAEHGYCWSKVAAALPRRTDNMCRRRWKKLLPHEVPLLQAAKKMQKAALICNFVDRESERPALGLDDFRPVPMITANEKINHCKKQTGRASKVRKTRRSKNSTENAQTGSDEGLAMTNHDEVETFDGRTAATGLGSENNNLIKPREEHPSCPLISPPNEKGLAASDSKRKKRTRKPHSTTEPDELRECLPLQAESLNLTSNSNGIEPAAETNTTLTKVIKKRRFKESLENAKKGSEQGLAVNIHYEVETCDGGEAATEQGSENNNLTKPQQEHPSCSLISSANEKDSAAPDSKRKKRSRKPSNGDGIEHPAGTNISLTNVRKTRGSKKSMENAQTGSEEGLALNIPDEVETFDGREVATGQVSENNNFTKPGQEHPSHPLIAPDNKKKKRSHKPHSSRTEHIEPDEVRECDPLQPETLNLTTNTDGIEPPAEANATLTNVAKRRRFKKSMENARTGLEEGLPMFNHDEVETFKGPEAATGQGSENNNLTKPVQEHPSCPHISSANDKGLAAPDCKRKKPPRKPPSRGKERTKPDEVGKCLPLQPELANDKGLAAPDCRRKKPPRKPPSRGKERTKPDEVGKCLPLQPESSNLTSNGVGIGPPADTKTTLNKARRISKQQCSRSMCTAKSEELQSATVSSGRSLFTATIADVQRQHNGSSCMESTELLVTNGEVTLRGNDIMASKTNTCIKQYCRRKKGSEHAGVLEDAVPVPSRDDEQKDLKHRGTCFDQNLGAPDQMWL